MEHYVTLFDSNFVLAGVALHDSLAARGGPFTLWVLATDDRVVEELSRLGLRHVRVVPLAEVETPELRAVKGGRTRGEYSWTLTPFTAQMVFDRDPTAARVTYLDADLFFLDDPAPFFAEFEASGADVLVTEHAFAPEYDRSRLSGRFCVQFLTFRNTPGGREVMRWWQDRCVEWCFDRYEDGKFGDQKYLDRWPELFGPKVHVLSQKDRTVAPWNVDHIGRGGPVRPVFYHMQGFRILGPRRVKLFQGCWVTPASRWVYDGYLAAIEAAAARLVAAGFPVPVMPEHRQPLLPLRRLALRALRRVAFVDLPRPLGEGSAG